MTEVSLIQLHTYSDPSYFRQAAVLVHEEIYKGEGELNQDLVSPYDALNHVYALIGEGAVCAVAALYDVSKSMYGQGPAIPEFELGLLAVQPEYQGKGVGVYMIREMERRAARLGAAELRIAVARGLEDYYRRWGYEVNETDECMVRPLHEAVPPVAAPQLELTALAHNRTYRDYIGGLAVETLGHTHYTVRLDAEVRPGATPGEQ